MAVPLFRSKWLPEILLEKSKGGRGGEARGGEERIRKDRKVKVRGRHGKEREGKECLENGIKGREGKRESFSFSKAQVMSPI